MRRHQGRRPVWAFVGHLCQAYGFLVVASITHGRRRLPPAHGCPAGLPYLLVGPAEVVQGLALAVPVPGLPVDRGRVLAGTDRLLKPRPVRGTG